MRPLLAVLVLGLPLGSSAIAAERLFDLTIAHGRLTGGQDTVRVQQNDNVVLRWRSDRPIFLHLHGYEIETRVVPGTVAETRFKAHAAGRFPIHLHAAQARSEAVLVYLEVYPEEGNRRPVRRGEPATGEPRRGARLWSALRFAAAAVALSFRRGSGRRGLLHHRRAFRSWWPIAHGF
jgi:hypothetical protein